MLKLLGVALIAGAGYLWFTTRAASGFEEKVLRSSRLVLVHFGGCTSSGDSQSGDQGLRGCEENDPVKVTTGQLESYYVNTYASRANRELAKNYGVPYDTSQDADVVMLFDHGRPIKRKNFHDLICDVCTCDPGNIRCTEADAVRNAAVAFASSPPEKPDPALGELKSPANGLGSVWLRIGLAAAGLALLIVS